VVPLSDLRERELPEQIPQEFQSAVRASWQQPDVAIGDGEPHNVAQARGLRALRYMLSRHPAETIVAATHGNLLALLLNGLDSSYGYEFWRRMTFPDVYELCFQDTELSSVRRVWTEYAQHGRVRFLED
jgi:2,3-bisphosphoglycerate-dependent phosphoglycerate mutase